MSINLWLRRPKPHPQARLRLFCFHFAGGSASVYRTWPAALAPICPDVEVCAVQLPGRENRLREAPFTQIGPLVTALLTALRSELDRPFALFGHSMGALVAYELAQTLQYMGGPQPTHLLVSGRRAPSLPDPLPPLHVLPTDDMLRAIGRRYGNLPDLLLQDAELKAIYAPLLQADFSVVETYQPSTLTPLTCPLSVFGGDADPIATEVELQAWRPLTRSHFALHLLPGGHFYLQEQTGPLLERIATALLLQTQEPIL
ncbi:MAG: alpha/beta fold hydrolase [Caldilineaceae bacterium]